PYATDAARDIGTGIGTAGRRRNRQDRHPVPPSPAVGLPDRGTGATRSDTDTALFHVLPEPAEGAGPGTSRARVRRCARRPPRPGDGSSAVQGRDRGDAAVRPPDAGVSDDGGLGAGNAAQTRGANARLRSSADG